MSTTLRVLLILCSTFTFTYVIRKIQQSQVKIGDVSFWVLFSVTLVGISVVPRFAVWLSELLGIATGTNCVFLIIIFLLMAELFLQSVKVSKMESKIADLAGEIAIKAEADKMAGTKE